MKKMTLALVFLLPNVLIGCATQNRKIASTPSTKSAKVLEQERLLREKEESQQDMKDRNRVLNRKSEIQASSLPVRAVPQNKKIEILGAADSHQKKSDRELYAELVNSFDRNNEIAFFSRLQSFLQNHAQSPLADDALYLAGLMSLSNKNYGPALRYMNQVLKNYPTSNKISPALFAKGVILKKMNLSDESKVAFLKVRKTFPGSPEALRAETELKLMTRSK